MINLHFSLRAPWFKDYRNILLKDGKTPFKNKFWELQIDKDDVLFMLGFAIRQRCSHAGLSFEIGLLGYWLNFNFYDDRHWDYARGEWEK